MNKMLALTRSEQLPLCLKNAFWIYIHDEIETKKRSVVYRNCFNIDIVPDSCKLYVSADSSYRLYVNGIYISIGPQRGDRHRTYYDTLKIDNALKPGKNIIAAHVLKYPSDAIAASEFGTGPISCEGTTRGGLIVAAEC